MKIAIIAHDGRKTAMVQFLFGYKEYFTDVELVATGTTGTHVEQAGLSVHKMLSGPLGGDAQIATMVVEKEIDLVIFFRDPLGKHPHEPDVQMLLRLCDLHDVPLATNPASAKLMLKAIFDK
jgi:methylglyoxal synthase